MGDAVMRLWQRGEGSAPVVEPVMRSRFAEGTELLDAGGEPAGPPEPERMEPPADGSATYDASGAFFPSLLAGNWQDAGAASLLSLLRSPPLVEPEAPFDPDAAGDGDEPPSGDAHAEADGQPHPPSQAALNPQPIQPPADAPGAAASTVIPSSPAAVPQPFAHAADGVHPRPDAMDVAGLPASPAHAPSPDVATPAASPGASERAAHDVRPAAADLPGSPPSAAPDAAAARPPATARSAPEGSRRVSGAEGLDTELVDGCTQAPAGDGLHPVDRADARGRDGGAPEEHFAGPRREEAAGIAPAEPIANVTEAPGQLRPAGENPQPSGRDLDVARHPRVADEPVAEQAGGGAPPPAAAADVVPAAPEARTPPADAPGAAASTVIPSSPTAVPQPFHAADGVHPRPDAMDVAGLPASPAHTRSPDVAAPDGRSRMAGIPAPAIATRGTATPANAAAAAVAPVMAAEAAAPAAVSGAESLPASFASIAAPLHAEGLGAAVPVDVRGTASAARAMPESRAPAEGPTPGAGSRFGDAIAAPALVLPAPELVGASEDRVDAGSAHPDAALRVEAGRSSTTAAERGNGTRIGEASADSAERAAEGVIPVVQRGPVADAPTRPAPQPAARTETLTVPRTDADGRAPTVASAATEVRETAQVRAAYDIQPAHTDDPAQRAGAAAPADTDGATSEPRTAPRAPHDAAEPVRPSRGFQRRSAEPVGQAAAASIASPAGHSVLPSAPEALDTAHRPRPGVVAAAFDQAAPAEAAGQAQGSAVTPPRAAAQPQPSTPREVIPAASPAWHASAAAAESPASAAAATSPASFASPASRARPAAPTPGAGSRLGDAIAAPGLVLPAPELVRASEDRVDAGSAHPDAALRVEAGRSSTTAAERGTRIGEASADSAERAAEGLIPVLPREPAADAATRPAPRRAGAADGGHLIAKSPATVPDRADSQAQAPRLPSNGATSEPRTAPRAPHDAAEPVRPSRGFQRRSAEPVVQAAVASIASPAGHSVLPSAPEALDTAHRPRPRVVAAAFDQAASAEAAGQAQGSAVTPQRAAQPQPSTQTPREVIPAASPESPESAASAASPARTAPPASAAPAPATPAAAPPAAGITPAELPAERASAASRRAAAERMPSVQVEIGRVEVTSPAPPARPRRARAGPLTPLDQYARRWGGGRR